MSCGSLSQFSPNLQQPMPTMATLSRMARGFIAGGAYDPPSGAARGARERSSGTRKMLDAKASTRRSARTARRAPPGRWAGGSACPCRRSRAAGSGGHPRRAIPRRSSRTIGRAPGRRRRAACAGSSRTRQPRPCHRSRVVRVDLPHDEDLLGVVHLVPDRLQHLAEERRVGKLPVHELAHIAEAHVAAPQLGARQDAPTTLAYGVVPLEGEVDFVDAVALRGGAEGRLRPRRAAAEENAVLALHARSSPGTFSPIARTRSNGRATR